MPGTFVASNRLPARFLHTLSLCLYLAAVGFSSRATAAEDWPNFRGPRHDGISRETGLKTDWSTPIPLVWEREVGSAFSSFAIVDGKLYTCGTEDGQQVLFCLGAADGAVQWKKPFEPAYVERQGGDGTRSTPTVNDGKVYIFGAAGTLVCFDAADGREVWRKRFEQRPTWGYSGSVLVDGDLAIFSPGPDSGGLVAVNRNTGEQVWRCGEDPAGYSTPYPFDFEGTRYVVGFMGKGAIVAELQTGREVLRYPWPTSYDVNAAAPIFHDGHLFLSSGYDVGAVLLKLSKAGDKLKAEKVWQNRNMRNKFQSSVLFEGNLYASDESALKCVDLMSGEKRWEVRRNKDGTVLLADGHLFVLTERGTLQIAPISPKEFKPATEAEILSGRCWTVPVIYDGKLYARNLTRLVCFSLRP